MLRLLWENFHSSLHRRHSRGEASRKQRCIDNTLHSCELFCSGARHIEKSTVHLGVRFQCGAACCSNQDHGIYSRCLHPSTLSNSVCLISFSSTRVYTLMKPQFHFSWMSHELMNTSGTRRRAEWASNPGGPGMQSCSHPCSLFTHHRDKSSMPGTAQVYLRLSLSPWKHTFTSHSRPAALSFLINAYRRAALLEELFLGAGMILESPASQPISPCAHHHSAAHLPSPCFFFPSFLPIPLLL